MCGIPASFIFLLSAGRSSSTSFLTCAEASLTSGPSSASFSFCCPPGAAANPSRSCKRLCTWLGKGSGFHSNGGPALPSPSRSRMYFSATLSTFFCSSSAAFCMSSGIFGTSGLPASAFHCARRAQRVLQSLNRLAVFGRALFHGVQLIHGCAPRRAILRGKLHVRIILDHDFLRCFLGPGLDFNCVLSGFYSRAARTFPVSGVDGLHLFRRGLCGSIVTQVPIRAIHAGRARSVQLAHYLPVFVGDGDLDLAFFL